MIVHFNQWKKHFKIGLFAGIFVLFSLADFFIFIAHFYEKLRLLEKEKFSLNQNWQKLNQSEIHRKKLLQDIALLQYPYTDRLKALRQPTTPPSLYTQIGLLAKSHSIEILALKPKKHQVVANLEQQIFDLEISGSELKLLSFLQLLMHQSWLLEIQQLEFTAMNNSTHIQATLSAYYDSQ